MAPDSEIPGWAQLSGRLAPMVRRLPPGGSWVVPGSTPVIAFGDFLHARVATLGINPSRKEFTGDNGLLLTGSRRRLATLESLRAHRLDQLDDRQVGSVLADCVSYFERQPYRRWFDPLDGLSRATTGASYYDGSACHLDLVQWATDPTWANIPDVVSRRALLEDGTPHLRTLPTGQNLDLIMVNGREVINKVQITGLADLIEVARIQARHQVCRLYAGSGAGTRWFGWSVNLQSSWGVSTAFKDELAARFRSADFIPWRHGPAREGAGMANLESGYLPRGLQIASKEELVRVLSKWLEGSDAQTVGEVGSYAGRPWLWIQVSGRELVLHADTRRTAVEAFVRANAADPNRLWRVVATARAGIARKVLPGPDGDAAPGWYCYLTHPGAAGELI
jgi:hypothetical protein